MTRNEKSVLVRVTGWLCLTSLFFVVSVANASPTIANRDAILLISSSPADTQSSTACVINNIVEPVNAELANLGIEFLQPPASLADLGGARNNSVKSLPAVPATMLMVLIGFLCVSFVRDRRVWLSAMAGLLWIGHAGVQAIPQLALRLSHKNHSEQQLYAELTYPHCLENSKRLRSDIEGTQYIGLLHHLAGIPGAGFVLNSCFSILESRFLRASSVQHPALSIEPLALGVNTSQRALLSEQYSLNSPFNCLASIAEQFVYFSPAFIFDNLARGPPLLA